TDVEEGGLTGAVRTDQEAQLAALDGQVEGVEDGEAAERDCHAVEREDQRASAGTGAVRRGSPGSRSRRRYPTSPSGNNSTTPTKSPPKKYCQTSGNDSERPDLAVLTSTAPSTAPT